MIVNKIQVHFPGTVFVRALLGSIILLFLLDLFGCRTSRTLNLGDISSAKVQEVIRTHQASVRSMKGNGRISVETPRMAQRGSFELTLQKPDSILINIYGPFGINVGSALVTRTEFLFYNSLENKLISGSSNKENLDRILHVQLSFDDLMNFFAGGTFLTEDLHPPDDTQVQDDQYIFIYTSGNTTRWYWIDPVTRFIQKVQILDRGGMITFEQTFDDYEDVDGISMPHSIRIKQPISRQMLALTFSDILVNTRQLQFSFTIPQNVERIRW